jgi:hypothetical protein
MRFLYFKLPFKTHDLHIQGVNNTMVHKFGFVILKHDF